MKFIKRLFGIKDKRRIEWGKSARGPGYSDSKLIHSVRAKTLARLRLLRETQPVEIDHTGSKTLVAIGLCLRDNDSLRVLDVGGSFGIHYFTALAVWQSRFQWHVVELPAITECVGSIAAITHHLQFFSSISDACKDFVPDLVFSSGALPYTLDPYNALWDLIALRSKYLYLTRVVLTDGDEDLHGVQHSMLGDNGPGPLPEGIEDIPIEYPLVVSQKKKVEKLLTTHFRKVLCFAEDNFFDLKQYGYFCER